MWSRKFLWQGLTTGALAAALALGGTWLLLFVVSRSTDPGWTIANIVKFCLPGLILYPVCWYAWVYRHRDYSAGRTMTLVIVTFLVVWALVAILMGLGGAYVASTMVLEAAKPAKVFWLVPLAVFAYGIMTAIGAAILFLPFIIVAAPVAFLHRWLLLLLIAPNLGAPPPTLAAGSSKRSPG
jgi:hypothetical protein